MNEPLLAWECVRCGSIHETQENGAACCNPLPILRHRCPVCRAVHAYPAQARYCCEHAEGSGRSA